MDYLGGRMCGALFTVLFAAVHGIMAVSAEAMETATAIRLFMAASLFEFE